MLFLLFLDEHFCNPVITLQYCFIHTKTTMKQRDYTVKKENAEKFNAISSLVLTVLDQSQTVSAVRSADYIALTG